MLNVARWRVILVIVVTLLGIVFAAPNVLSERVRESLPGFLPRGAGTAVTIRCLWSMDCTSQARPPSRKLVIASTSPSRRSRPVSICSTRSWTSVSNSRNRNCDSVPRRSSATRPT